ncbi:UNVERIFIED_ORG: hypothetical protein FNL38_104427 [Nocardia globerula]|uniref:Uncharacterized protein n=1 Tax=Nocardia globerula TaxID=1818 RepID=A0A652YPV6_NOCGL|nr:helix-turn-helix transcriptional regulator [Rhodococcus globerulus]NMD62710.1 helix-turn-helix transcriptional regulator [Nocardia globerula]PVX68163.1 hypothetical protein C8E04_5543 [Rhodococcus globerulus]
MAEWDKALADRIGQAVKSNRTARGWTAARLSEETEKLGHSIHRVAIGKLENGHRGAKFDVAELVILAEALDIPPVQLLFPKLVNGECEYLPGKTETSWRALQRFTGETSKPLDLLAAGPRNRDLTLMRMLAAGESELEELRAALSVGAIPKAQRAQSESRIAELERVAQLTRESLEGLGYSTGKVGSDGEA